MTVSATTSRADYIGNGTTTAFAVPFYFLDQAHLTVLSTVTATGVSTTLTIGTDYTVTGAGVPAGGTVTLTVAPTSSQKISILRNVPLTQNTHYVENDPFPAASHEQALDKLTMEVQQVNESVSRALTLSPATTGVSASLPNPVAQKIIGWDQNGTALANYGVTDLAATLAGGTFTTQRFSGNGATTGFTLSATPASVSAVEVFISGVRQVSAVDYNIAGTSLIFTSAPASGTNNIFVRWGSASVLGYDNASAVNYIQSGTGAVTRDVQTKLREFVSVKDFGAVGDGVTDDTAAIQSAATACLTTGQTLFVPAGTYKITSTITISGISVICEDPRTTKFQAVGNFTAFKFLCNGKTLKNFNLWFTPPVSSAAVGYQFGEGATQFARNNVENFAVRYASTAYYASSDMWGNVFTQMNADFPLVYGYNFTANPSGTTNSFRNLYATNAHTTGSITSGTPTLTVADATNMSAGQTWVVLGAGATGALVTTILSVVGTTVTLAANAANTVSSAPVLSAGTAWQSLNFSDTHFYNAYFDGYPSSANGRVGAVYFADSNLTADCIRFEGCAVISANTALIDDRANSSKVGSILSFATYVDSGAGNYGFIYRCGANSLTQHMVGDVQLEGFAQWSGGLKKLRVSSNDNLTFLGKGASATDSDDNGYEGCLFYSDIVGRVSTSTPATGSWEIGDQYFVKTPVAGGASGGVCLSSGTFGTLTSVTANTISGSNKITLSGLSTLKRNQFITIAGVSGVFKVIDLQTGASTTALVVPAPGSTVSSAAVAYATPTFARSGSIELTASTTWDPPSVGIGGSTATTLTVNGAVVGDYAIASFDQSLQSLQLTAYVYTTNGVAVTLSNSLGGAVDLPSGTLRVRVIKQ